MPGWKILIADGLDESGLSLLRDAASVEDRTGISAQDLLEEIPGYAALIVRSRTRVSEAVFQAGQDLRVVGRAGVGVDNIDLAAASYHRVAVVNAGIGGNRILTPESYPPPQPFLWVCWRSPRARKSHKRRTKSGTDRSAGSSA